MKRKILICIVLGLGVFTQISLAQDVARTEEILEKKYSFVCYLSSNGGWFTVELNNKVGVCDLKGKEVIPCMYDDVYFYGDYYEVKLNEKVAIRDLNNQELLPFKYEKVLWSQIKNYGYAEIKLNSKVGVVDKLGKEIVAPKYDEVSIFQFKDNDIAIVKLNNKVGVVDKQGKEIILCKYDNVLLSGGTYYITLNGKKGSCDLTGKEVIPCKYDEVCLHTGYYGVTLNGKEGACDLTGKEVIPCKYDKVLFYEKSGLYSVNIGGIKNEETYITDGGKWGLLDKTGAEIIPCKYANCTFGYFENNDYASVNVGGISIEYKVTGGQWGLINKMGNEVIPCVYDGITMVSEGLVGVNKGGSNNTDGICVGGKWGYVDLKGNVIIEPQYDTVEGFKDGAAMVSSNGQSMLIENPLKKGSANISANLSNTTITSDVDVNIPVEKTDNNSETFVFIVANENYPQAKVPFALNDGRVFKAYCQKTLGIPEQNIKMYEDATYGNLVSAINKIKKIADVFDGEVRIIFYYAGHGVPDEKDNTAYLLPIDGLSNNSSITGYSIAKLNQELGNLRAKSVTVLLDACFSGAKRQGDMLASSRGVAIKVNNARPVGNMIVFSASSGDETAHQYKEKGHGLFTYYLLKKLQESKGDLSYQELTDYVMREVKRQSVVINNKRQTPTITISDNMNSNWANLKLK